MRFRAGGTISSLQFSGTFGGQNRKLKKETPGQELTGILKRNAWMTIERPALGVDLTSRHGLTLEVDRDTHLLDVMVWTIVLSRKRLAICKRRHCPFSYFIRPKNKTKGELLFRRMFGASQKTKKAAREPTVVAKESRQRA
jgi:hypothetical protein